MVSTSTNINDSWPGRNSVTPPEKTLNSWQLRINKAWEEEEIMEEKHRKAIIQNVLELTTIQNFNSCIDQLVKSGVYNQHMVDVLLANVSTKELKAQKFFLDVQTRGPNAFRCLFDALVKTGNADVAFKMTSDSKDSSFNYKNLGNKHGICLNQIASWIEDEVDSSSNSSFDCAPPLKKAKPYEEGDSADDDDVIIRAVISPRLNLLSGTGSKKKCAVEEEVVENENDDIFVKEIPAPQSSEPPEITLCVFGNVYSKITVVPAKELYNGYKNLKECYIMKSRPRGLALIVNNIEFLGDPASRREGAEYDSVNLQTLLVEMGYDVTLAENVTKDDLLKFETGILSNFIKKVDKSDADSCIVSLNSHGFNRDLIRMADPPGKNEEDSAIDLVSDVIRQFSNRNFPGFHGKPKLFLVNACRGSNENRAVRKSFDKVKVQADGESSFQSKLEIGSEYSDIFVLRSTVPEYVSLRDLDRGTWFVECLCKAFALYAHELHFTELKCKVSAYMEKMYDETSRGMQSCHYEEYGITKRLYFNPGL